VADEKIHRICCVCGVKLPQLSIDDLVMKGAVSLQGTGQRLYHCPKHTLQEIIDSQTEMSGFRRASELVK
jgi:hypothetical protein